MAANSTLLSFPLNAKIKRDRPRCSAPAPPPSPPVRRSDFSDLSHTQPTSSLALKLASPLNSHRRSTQSARRPLCLAMALDRRRLEVDVPPSGSPAYKQPPDRPSPVRPLRRLITPTSRSLRRPASCGVMAAAASSNNKNGNDGSTARSKQWTGQLFQPATTMQQAGV